MDEKPLHVRVAEAVGWEVSFMSTVGEPRDWHGFPPGADRTPPTTGGYGGSATQWWPVPRFDTDWRSAGPLLDRFRMDVIERDLGLFVAGVSAYRGVRSDEDPGWPVEGIGPTRLLAVCDLILKLWADGTLDG